MTAVMLKLADDDLDVSIPARQRTDEIGAMERSIEVFKQTPSGSGR